MSALYKVAWVNVMHESVLSERGSKLHITTDNDVCGRTLCGKSFPDQKGYPGISGVCKRCINIAYAQGQPKGFSKSLEWVPSTDD